MEVYLHVNNLIEINLDNLLKNKTLKTKKKIKQKNGKIDIFIFVAYIVQYHCFISKNIFFHGHKANLIMNKIQA